MHDRRRVIVVLTPWGAGHTPFLHGVSQFTKPTDRWDVQVVVDQWMLTERLRLELDGVILHSPDEKVVAKLKKLGIPVVSVLNGTQRDRWGHVELDDQAIGKMAAQHLMSKGLKRFGYWGQHVGAWDIDRQQGFEEALRQRGRPCSTVRDIIGPDKPITWSALFDGNLIRRWLKQLSPPVGVMLCCDGPGAQLIRVAREVGLSVPDDVSIIGVNNQDDCELLPVPLTSLDPNVGKVAFTAAELLDRMMDGHPAPSATLRLPPREVVQRRSTDCMAIEDADVRSALGYIREFGARGISISDVLKRVAISRRRLEQRFVKEIGHTPGKELRRVKLQRAASLLRNTTYKLDGIALQCGFRNGSHLSVAFRREFGVAPSQYRKGST